MASPSRRRVRVPRPRAPLSLRLLIVQTLLLVVAALSVSPARAASPPTTGLIHRRRECVVDTLAHAAFTDVADVDAFFDQPHANSSVSPVEWQRVDTCGDAVETATANCVRGDHVALVDGRLSLSASPVAGGARVVATVKQLQQANTTTRLRVHASFPVNETASRSIAAIALSLPHGHGTTTVTLSVLGSPPRLRLASPAHNWSVSLAPPCPLTSSTKIHVVDVEWTPTRWLRWHWDGHLLRETRLPKHETPTLNGSAPLHVAFSVSATNISTATAQLHIKAVEVQRVASGQDEAVCRPRVLSPEANCRHHTHFEPRLGVDQGYLSLAQIYEFVRSVPMRFPMELTKLEEIGVSRQNRSLLALCVGACSRDDAPQVLFTGMHHSREPISMMNLVYTIDLLALDFANGVVDTTALLLSRQLWFVLVVNPDGYARNEELEMWKAQLSGQRKNARPGCDRNGADSGVDLNRNYDVCFSEDDVGSSTDPCGEDYRGPAPFSEPETMAIKRFVEKPGSHFSVSLNYHSFGRFFNVPFACKALDSPRGTNLTVFKNWAKEMTRYNGFAYGQPWKDDNLYSVNGETSDWLWSKHGIFSMSPEVGPAFSTRTDKGFWPDRDEVPELATELHYSNIVAARLAGPQYEVTITNVTRQLATEEDDSAAADIEALLLVKLTVVNRGLRTAGDLEIVLASSLSDANSTNALTSSSTISTADLRGVQHYKNEAVTRVLAIPESPVVHVIVRDSLSCQYVRLTTQRKSTKNTHTVIQQWSAVELPLCGFCRTIGRDTKQLETLAESAVCNNVSDLLDIKRLARARVTRLKPKKQAATAGSTGETREADPPPATTAVTASPKPVATSSAPSAVVSEPPSVSTVPTTELTDPATNSPVTTHSPVPANSAPSTSTEEAADDTISASHNSSASASSFASFASVPVIATLFLIALVAVVFVVRRRHRHLAETSGKAPPAKSGRRKKYVKVVNNEDEAEQLEQDDEQKHADDRTAIRRNPFAAHRDDTDDDDAEYGHRRGPNGSRPRGPSDDELV